MEWQKHLVSSRHKVTLRQTSLSDTLYLTCHLSYNIDASKEITTQTSSLNNDKTREAVTEQPPPALGSHDLYSDNVLF